MPNSAARRVVAKVSAEYPQPQRSRKGKTCEVQVFGGNRHAQYVKCGEPATSEVDGVRVCEEHA